jgi:Transcriptional regulator
MSIKERKERERDKMRELILNTASQIISEDGIDNLSIRKIAGRIDYSPSIIYHYFKDKDEIINHLMKRNYRKIVSAISSAEEFSDEPEQKIKETMRRYIDLALQMPDEYMTILVSNSPSILEHTSTLFHGASSKRQALGILSQCLKDIFDSRDIDDNFIELTTQVIWTSTFGLIIRLIIERDLISEEQRRKLIEHYIKLTVDAMIMGKPLFG